MKLKLSALVFLASMSLTTAANAFVIEPYYSHVLSGENGNNNDLEGNSLGLRLGYDTLGFAFGLDYTASGTAEFDGSTTNWDVSGYGAYVSYDFPILLRGYVSYMLNYEYKEGNTTRSGKGSKIGVQYTGLPFIALGVEMGNFSFDEQNVSGTKSDIDAESKYTGFVVSFPFGL